MHAGKTLLLARMWWCTPSGLLSHLCVGVIGYWPQTSGPHQGPKQLWPTARLGREVAVHELAAEWQVHGWGGKQPVNWAVAADLVPPACTERLLQVHDWGGKQACGQSCSSRASTLC